MFEKRMLHFSQDCWKFIQIHQYCIIALNDKIASSKEDVFMISL